MKKVLFMCASLLILAFLAIGASNAFNEKSVENQTLAPVENENDAQLIFCKKYLEGACIVNNQAGIACVVGKGSCKKLKSCEAVPPLQMALPGYPTVLEMDAGAIIAADILVATDDFCFEEWQAAYDVCYESYNDYYYPSPL